MIKDNWFPLGFLNNSVYQIIISRHNFEKFVFKIVKKYYFNIF